jgi:tetratricopeptide (TPR) repeat protein
MKKILLTALLFSLMVCLTPLAWAGALEDVKAGEDAFYAGNCDEAIRLYTKAIVSGELSRVQLREAYCDRGYTWWFCKGYYDKAIADYTKAIEIDPKYADVYYDRGDVWYDKGDYDKAIADYTKAIEINPKFIPAYKHLGDAWREKGYYDKAIASYTKAIEIDPNPKYAAAYDSLAWLMATCPESRYRDGKRAVDLAEKALKSRETAARLDILAAACAEVGRFQEAINTQKRAIAKLKQEGNTKLIAECEKHLASYKAGKPWREKRR